MPIYDFQCKKCGHVTTFLEQYSSAGEHACEKCGSKQTERLFSTFAAQAAGGSPSASSCPTGQCPLS